MFFLLSHRKVHEVMDSTELNFMYTILTVERQVQVENMDIRERERYDSDFFVQFPRIFAV